MPYELLPIASYVAKALPNTAQWNTTGSGNDQLVMQFQIDEGEHTGRFCTWFATFTENTLERIVESLRHCGWVGDDLSELGDLPNQVQIVVEHNTWNGKTTDRIAWVNRLGGGNINLKNQKSVDEVRQFAAMMKGKISALGEPGSKKDSLPWEK